jgi:hypothetical protein
VANVMKNYADYALIFIGQFMWAEQIKSYNGNTIAPTYFSKMVSINQKYLQIQGASA